jgi:hypothetical protein
LLRAGKHLYIQYPDAQYHIVYLQSRERLVAFGYLQQSPSVHHMEFAAVCTQQIRK